MFIFNPEHDLSLANGDAHFVPPESALSFGRDCAGLTKYMPGLEIDEITPWGWDYLLKQRLLKEGVSSEYLPSDAEIDLIRELSDRRVAVESLYQVHSHIKAEQLISPDYRIIVRDMEELYHFLSQNENILLKASLSGSGKGLRFVRHELSHSDAGWCKKLLATHGEFIAERREKLFLEFAMLFEVNSCVKFRGYSLFYTQNGIYSGNLLACDAHIENILCRYLERELLIRVREALQMVLEQKFLNRGYRGYVGADQFLAVRQLDGNREQIIYNPLMEFNVRMTMGLLARNIYDNFKEMILLEEGVALGDGTHSFVIHRNRPEKGRYSYSFESLS